MSSQVVTYAVDDSTKVSFEIDPSEGFRPASPGRAITKVRDAVGPAVEAAKAVLDKVKDIRPDGIELTFGIKVSGGTDWLIAKTAGEANFEIKLTWSPKDKLNTKDAGEPAAIEAADSAAGKEATEPAKH